MPQQPVKLEITNFGGLNIERGLLTRPMNTFKRLENWDLIKEGGIRKAKGLRFIGPINIGGPLPLESPIVAFRDYQRSPEDDFKVLAVTKDGKLYSLPGFGDFLIGGFAPFDLLSSGELNESPFLGILQGQFGDETIQYAIITLDSQDFPKKFDGTTVTRLGIARPDSIWTIDSENSIIVREIETIADRDLGIQSNRGHKYRWRFYNPTTNHLSAPAPISNKQGNIRAWVGETNDTLKILPGSALSTAFGVDDRYIRQVRLSIDDIGGANEFGINYEDWINQGYTKIRIERTRDGGDEFYFLPRLYDRFGALLTDEDGNISIIDSRFEVFADSESVDYESANDGYVSVRDIENVDYNWKVNGGGQSGSELVISVDNSTVDFTGAVSALIIRIDGDPTNYSIIEAVFVEAIDGTHDSWRLTIEPELAQAPSNNVVVTIVNLLPVLDEELTPLNTVPSDNANDPPPKASWGTVYQGRLWLVDALDKTRLVYSEVGDFQSFPAENFFTFLDDDLAPITAVLASKAIGLVSEGADTKLIVGKSRSTAQIAGTGRPEIISTLGGVTTTDFDRRPLHAETGIVSKKAARVVEERLIALTRRGLETLESQQPQFIGSLIRELTDQIIVEDEGGPSFAVDREQGQILAAIRLPDIELASDDAPDIDQNRLLLIRTPFLSGSQGGLVSPFAIYTLPTDVCCIYESGSGDQIRLLVAGANGLIYELFRGGTYPYHGPADILGTTYFESPMVAVAETQELPSEEKEQRKIFRSIRFDGVSLDDDWKIAYSCDGGQTFTPDKQMRNENLIGLTAKTIVIRITHDGLIPDDQPAPFLSNMCLTMIPIGRAR